MRYPVNEIFRTIQGEGFWSGTPSVFIRLQGCPVGCPWCDTKHTWDEGDPEFQLEPGFLEIKAPGGNSPTWANCSVAELVAMANGPIGHVVITGGEPCMHDLVPLASALEADGHRVQVETSGTFEVRITPRAWVTVSPKVNMPGGFGVKDAAIGRANEIKMPVGKQRDLDHLELLLMHRATDAVVCVQPLSLNPSATRLCRDYALAKGNVMVSLQTHRLVDWP